MAKYKVIMDNKIWSFTIEADEIVEEEDGIMVTKFYEEIDDGIYDLIDFRASEAIEEIKEIE
jgi:hypothetical protein